MKKAFAVLVLASACGGWAFTPGVRAQPEDSTVKPGKIEPRDAFLQKHFTNFPVLTFRAATNGETVIQRLRVRPHTLTFQGRRYTGFRFTTPDWLDGDFEWMYFHLTNEENRMRRVRARWYILPEQGVMTGFDTYYDKPLNAYPVLKRRFPNSREAFTQKLDARHLQPVRDYLIWFAYLDDKPTPDIAVALTINSERGHGEFGTLPTR